MIDGQHKRDRRYQTAWRYVRGLSVGLVAEGVKWLVGIAVAAVIPLGVFPWARENWQIVIGLVLVLAGNAALIQSILRKSRQKKTELLYFKSIVASCGIEGFWPFVTPEDKERGWQDCGTRIAENRFGDISIADCTVFLFRWDCGRDKVLLHQDEYGVRHAWPSL